MSEHESVGSPPPPPSPLTTVQPSRNSRASRGQSANNSRPSSRASSRISGRPPTLLHSGSRPISQLSDRNSKRVVTIQPTARIKPTPDEVRTKFNIAENLDFMTLRQMKKAAIKDLNYDLSEGLQVLIEYSDSNENETFLVNLKKWVKEHLRETLNRLEANIVSLEQRRHSQENDIGNDIVQVRDATEARHIDELTLVETNRVAELAAANRRETFEHRHALKHSQVLAGHDEVEAAIRMKDVADEEIRLVREDWANEINDRFARKVDQVTKRQIRELEEIQRVYDASVTLVNTRFESDVLVERRKAGVWIQRTLQKAISNPNLEIHKPGLRKQISERLTKSVHRFLRKQQQESLLHIE